jgi:glycine/D-amino acid oxidase-like deaminating enzyme
MSAYRTIIVGGGLAGLSAAHTLLEKGKRVLLLDKKPSYVLLANHSIYFFVYLIYRLGGNSVKASSGINGAGSEAQHKLNIEDTVEALYVFILSPKSFLLTPLES